MKQMHDVRQSKRQVFSHFPDNLLRGFISLSDGGRQMLRFAALLVADQPGQ